MNIHVHIERLILNGINILPSQRLLMEDSVRTELTRLLTDGGLSSTLAQSNSLPRISTNGIRLTGNTTVQIGQQIAQSVYGGIKHE